MTLTTTIPSTHRGTENGQFTLIKRLLQTSCIPIIYFYLFVLNYRYPFLFNSLFIFCFHTCSLTGLRSAPSTTTGLSSTAATSPTSTTASTTEPATSTGQQGNPEAFSTLMAQMMQMMVGGQGQPVTAPVILPFCNTFPPVPFEIVLSPCVCIPSTKRGFFKDAELKWLYFAGHASVYEMKGLIDRPTIQREHYSLSYGDVILSINDSLLQKAVCSFD